MRRKRFVHNISSEKIRFRNRFSHSVIDQTRNDGTSRESSHPVLTGDNEMDLDDSNDYGQNYDEMEHVHVKESNKESSSSKESSEENDDDDDDDNREDLSSSGESSEESNDNDDDNNEGSLSEEDEEHYQIVDEALDETKMPQYNIDNEFTPYFENFTTASMFCWLQKHNVSTSAYEDLAEIICNPQFNSAHIVKNVRRFRTWRQHLPLLPISARPISIMSKKTPSTSKNSKMAYQLSINDIIWYVLNNPSLMKHMYFGPGIDSEIKSEYWHGTLWGESPFFGEEEVIIFEGNLKLLK